MLPEEVDMPTFQMIPFYNKAYPFRFLLYVVISLKQHKNIKTLVTYKNHSYIVTSNIIKSFSHAYNKESVVTAILLLRLMEALHIGCNMGTYDLPACSPWVAPSALGIHAKICAHVTAIK